MKKISFWIISMIILVSGVIRFGFIPKLSFNTDEASVYTSTKLINQNMVPCDWNLAYCDLHGMLYSYITAVFTKLFGDSEYVVRSVNVFLFMLLQILLTAYMIRRKLSDKSIILFNALLMFCAWTYGLTYYARTYMTLTFFFSIFMIFAYEFFVRKYQEYMSLRKYLMFVLLGILTFLSQPLGYLIYIAILFMFALNFRLFKDKIFIICLTILFVLGYKYLSYNGIVPLDEGYMYRAKSINYQKTLSEWIISKIWFIQNFKFQNFYVIEFVKYFFPLIFIVLYLYIKKPEGKMRINYLLFFLVVFGFFLFYRGNWASPKYLLFMLPLFMLGFFFVIDGGIRTRIDKYVIYSLFSIFVVFNTPEIIDRITLYYGKDMSNLSITSLNSVEKYYPDDKTTVEFVQSIAQSDDFVITDYQITQKYLDMKAYGYIIPFDPYQNMKINPIAMFYDEGNYTARWFKNGPYYIRYLEQITNLIDYNKGKNIYIITSYDLINKYNHGRNFTIIDFLERNKDKVVYVGEDGNSKVFKFNSEYNK